MSHRGGGGGRGRFKKVMVQPINLLFRLLQQGATVSIWLYDQKNVRMEGHIRGFDEFMNIVLDDTVEVNAKGGTRTELGRILLKGDNIALIQDLSKQVQT
eukprot:m.135766 g.135766  ORF g.135766 m.135766 type:complete len:100 (-) comp10190_c0_seq1:110-409(-)